MLMQGIQIVAPDGTLTQAGYEMLKAMERRLDAAAAVTSATGGSVVDVQARAELVAIKAALA